MRWIVLVVVLGACDATEVPEVTVTPPPRVAVIPAFVPVRHAVVAPALPPEPEPAADDDVDPDGIADPAPVADTDTDDIPDSIDRCPDAPEDNEGFDDIDGCPDVVHEAVE